MTSGFLYLVSVFGVTGVRERLSQLTLETIRRIHLYTAGHIPLAVGFGISKPEHAEAVVSYGAEGVIVGSAFVKAIEDNLENEAELLNKVTKLAQDLKPATRIKSSGCRHAHIMTSSSS